MSLETVRQPLSGEEYAAKAPDTLDLSARAALAINALGGSIDPKLMTMFGQIVFCTSKPHFSHWASADTLLDPKFGESFPLMRLMCGSEQHVELEAKYRDAMMSRVQDGLYWDFCTPQRPWRNAYAPAFYGEGRNEDFCTLPGTARMLRALLVWRELGDDSAATEEAIRSLVAGLRRIAVCRDDYCYYPEKGGWGEPCSYPRSGWLNTDEAKGETEGGEGSVVCMHGHQIYGAAHWYAESRDPAALDLAARLTRYCMLPRFWGGVPDPAGDRTGLPGHVARSMPDPPFVAGHEQGHWFSHFHARAIALRGILEYARVAGDQHAAEFVRRSWEFTLSQGIARMGWINCYPGALNAVEGCALGDLVGLGIRLSDYGLGDYWDDVDGIVRNQLVEQQLTRPELLESIVQQFAGEPAPGRNAHPGQLDFDEGGSAVIARSIGSYGGLGMPTSVPRPAVMHCCTSNATQGLYAAWEGTLRESGDSAIINLLLNRAGRLVEIDSWLPFDGKVVIGNLAARRVAVRIPFWVDTSALRASVAGKPVEPAWVGRYLLFDSLKPGDVITITFPVPETTARYTVNAHTVQEQVYTCTFRGSTLIDISPRDTAPTSYPLYQRQHMRAAEAPMKEVQRFVPERIVLKW